VLSPAACAMPMKRCAHKMARRALAILALARCTDPWRYTRVKAGHAHHHMLLQTPMFANPLAVAYGNPATPHYLRSCRARISES